MGNQANIVTACAAALCALALGACESSKPKAPGLTDAASISDAYDSILAAQEAERRDKPEEAIELYRAGLQRYREFPAAWNNLGSLLMDEGRYLEAVECFRVAGDLAPKDPRPPYNQGLAWHRAGYLEDALEHYVRAVDRDPQYLPALRGAIQTERLLGRGTQTTLDRIRIAMLLDQDPKWRKWMELQRLRLETELAGPGVVPTAGRVPTPHE